MSFPLSDPRVFIVPIEELTEAGISEAFADVLVRERRVSPAWIELFDAAYRLYRERGAELSKIAPDSWFPPRKQNVCVVIDAERTRPYYLPFNKSSWLFYASDFDPEATDVELATYLFFHTERLCLTKSPAAAVAHNLGYFLRRSAAEREGFKRGASRCQRPDAPAFRTLAGALDFVGRLHHPQLRPLSGAPAEPSGKLPDSGLIVPLSLQKELQELVGAFRAAVTDVTRGYFARWGGQPGEVARFASWLAASAPPVLITGEGGDTLWDPAAPDRTDRLVAALDDLHGEVVDSLQADIAVAGERSQAFLSRLRRPEALDLPGDEIEQLGLTYIHATRRLIAYNLFEIGMNRCREVAAPYERLMLAARTIHEWGHLAVDAAIVRVPPDRTSEHARASVAVADLVGAEVRDRILRRMPDFGANVLARRFLEPDEMETYVRQQVSSLAQEEGGPEDHLARHAYELQYLRLSQIADPMGYLLDSTWFRERFVDTGVTTLARFRELCDAMQRLCDCYEIDESALG